jgi:deoxyribose-phosphate aldolase
MSMLETLTAAITAVSDSLLPFSLKDLELNEALAGAELAAYIDHTALKPDTTPEKIRQLCTEAVSHQFAAVCVNPMYLPLAAELVQGSPVKLCTVVGFPLGATPTAVKLYETTWSLDHGATEIDMVLPIGALKAEEYEVVYEDITAVVNTAHERHAIVKVIIETSLLTNREKVAACVIAQKAGADYVKTSTGFSSGGATTTDIALMRAVVGPDMGVKASGGLRTRNDALAMIAAGATRLGASSGVAILAE